MVNQDFLKFCSFIINTKTEEQLNLLPKDSNNLIDFASLYEQPKYRKAFDKYNFINKLLNKKILIF